MYFLGVDGGGSKCRATVASADGVLLGTGVSGPANPFQDTQQAQMSIVSATELALVDANLKPGDMSRLVAGVGLAGVNLPRFYDIMNAWDHPYRQMFLATDLHIACLGAHGGQDGAVIVAGTGSCGYYHIEGKSFICGAHGFPFGDKGSGAWMGLEAIKAALLASDDLGPATSLEQCMYEYMETDSLGIVEQMAGVTSDKYARLAPLVIAAATDNDEVAAAILREGANYLSAVARKLCTAEPPRISFLGGLGKQIVPYLDSGVATRLSPPLHEPDYGAILYAREQWQVQTYAKTEQYSTPPLPSPGIA